MSEQVSSGRAIAARGVGARLGRLVRLRLFIPILRARHSPEHTARGVSVGLLVALTPTVGVQMLIVLAIWLAVRRLAPQRDFNLLVAAAWTWSTNVLTLPPVYYVFLVTGRLLLGEWNAMPDFGTFVDQLRLLLTAEMNWLASLWVVIWQVFELWGLPMLVGSIPWAIAGAFFGYHWSLRLIRQFRRRRAR